MACLQKDKTLALLQKHYNSCKALTFLSSADNTCFGPQIKQKFTRGGWAWKMLKFFGGFAVKNIRIFSSSFELFPPKSLKCWLWGFNMNEIVKLGHCRILNLFFCCADVIHLLDSYKYKNARVFWLKEILFSLSWNFTKQYSLELVKIISFKATYFSNVCKVLY